MNIYDGSPELEGMQGEPFILGEWVAYRDDALTVIKVDPNIIRVLSKFLENNEKLLEAEDE